MNLRETIREHAMIRGAYATSKSLDNQLLYLVATDVDTELDFRSIRATNENLMQKLCGEVCRLDRLIEKEKLKSELKEEAV